MGKCIVISRRRNARIEGRRQGEMSGKISARKAKTLLAEIRTAARESLVKAEREA